MGVRPADARSKPASDNNSGAFQALISGVLDRLPMNQLLCDQLRAFPLVTSVHYAHVLWIGAPEDTGCPRVHSLVRLNMSRPVPGRTFGRFHPDFSRPIKLRRVRV